MVYIPIVTHLLGNSVHCSNEDKLSMQIFGLAFKVKPLYIMVGMATRTDGAAYKEWQTVWVDRHPKNGT